MGSPITEAMTAETAARAWRVWLNTPGQNHGIVRDTRG